MLRSWWGLSLVLLVLTPGVAGRTRADDAGADAGARLLHMEDARRRLAVEGADPLLHLALGADYFEIGNLASARYHLERSVALLPSGPDSLRAAHLLARTWAAVGLRLRATRALDHLAKRPDCPAAAFHDLAVLLREDHFAAQAAASEMEAVERSGGDPIYLRAAASLWKDLGRWDQALVLLEALQSAGAATSEDYFQLGLMAHRLDQPERARAAYEACLAGGASHPEAWYNLALVSRAGGDSAMAIRGFRQVLNLRPHYEPAYFQLGSYLLGAGREAEAEEVFQDFLEVGRDSIALDQARQIIYEIQTGGESAGP